MADAIAPLGGRSAGELKLRWQAPASQAPSAAPPALQLQLLDLALQDLALGPAARPVLALRELRLQNGSVDLGAGSADLGQLSLTRPVLNLARDSAGRWAWADLLRVASAGSSAETSTGAAAPVAPPP